jgi:hypothetical protein
MVAETEFALWKLPLAPGIFEQPAREALLGQTKNE